MKRFISIILVNFLILLLGIVVIEYIFGNWRGTRGADRLNVPQDVVIHKKISHLYSHKNGEIVYSRDKNGLRGPFTDVSKVDIVTVGGSTTDQSELGDGETWQDVLAADFRKDGREVQIANAGINGQSVIAHARSLRIWLRFIPGLKPRYVIAYLGINDVCFDPSIYRHYLLKEDNPLSYFMKRSALYYLYRTFRGINQRHDHVSYEVSIEMGRPDHVKLTDQYLLADPEMAYKEALNAYEERLRRLLVRTHEIGAELILVTQKTYRYHGEDGRLMGAAETLDCWGRRINGMDLYRALDLVNERTLKFCKNENLTCVDLANEVDFTLDDFYDFEHNTPAGAVKVGDYLYRKLKDVIK